MRGRRGRRGRRGPDRIGEALLRARRASFELVDQQMIKESPICSPNLRRILRLHTLRFVFNLLMIVSL